MRSALLPALFVPFLTPALPVDEEHIVARGERYVARIAERSLTVERLDPDGTPTGAALFHAELPAPRPGDVQLLADDGRAFVRVHLAYSEGSPVVRIWRQGERLELHGKQFDLAHEELVRGEHGTAWLADVEGTPAIGWLDTRDGPRLFLTLACVDGELRLIDLVDGTLRPREVPLELALRDPGEDPGATPLRPFLRSATAPRTILVGDPLPIRVDGEAFQSVQLATSEDGSIWVRPAIFGKLPARNPRTLQLDGLPEGVHTLRVRGREEPALAALEVDVLPRKTLLRLRTTGGIANIDEEILVTTDGARRVRRSPDGLDLRLPVDEPELRALQRLVRRLPATGPTRSGPLDGMQHQLLWRDASGAWRRMELAVTPERGPLGDLLRLVRDF